MRVLNTAKGRNSYVYPTLLLSGTATDLRFATNATGALMDNCPAALITEIQKYERVMIEIWDGSAVIRAYTGAAAIGDGEDLGDEFITSNNNLTYETLTINVNGRDIDQAVNSVGTGYASTNTGLSEKGLYYISTNCSVASGLGPRLGFADSTNGSTEWGSSLSGLLNQYRTAVKIGASATKINIYSVSAGDFSLVWSVRQVTGPTTSGALLYNSAGMTVQSVMLNTFTSTNYNKKSYTYKLWGNFKASGRGGYVR